MKTYKYLVEFSLHFTRYKEIVECVVSQQAREIIRMRYPGCNIISVEQIR